ncbi:hypothetical protein DRQ25_14050 [Candidatus Fermentibacteria bacterium]|nr:MAG: hypothetical protein DRQ25_14050 [Candidatus Fermentibacteria bacterium]
MPNGFELDEEYERARDGISYTKALLFHLDRTMKLFPFITVDNGIAIMDSVNGLESLLFPKLDEEYREKVKKIEREFKDNKFKMRKEHRVKYASEKLCLLMRLMDKQGYLGEGEVGSQI